MRFEYLAPNGAHAGGRVLECPICGGENIHPVRLSCTSPGRREGMVSIDGSGVSIDPRHQPHGRGVRIELEFTCENNGHAFAYTLQFHKGATLLVTALRGERDWRPTIWRD